MSADTVNAVTDMATYTPLTVEMLILLLSIASVVFIAVKRLKFPYTIGLVLVGLALSQIHVLPPVELSPSLILFIFLPALLFEAAWNLDIDHLKSNYLPIALMALVGVLLSSSVIGVSLYFLSGLPLVTSLLFGAMISATDPVSVLALFKKLGLDHRLAAIVEGESLFNDGTSVVVFKILLAFILMGGVNSGVDISSFLAGGFVQFVMVVAGGVLTGGVLGYVFSYLTGQFNDHLLELTFTTIVAYGSFLLAESIPVPGVADHLHLSGVISTVTAGLVVGNVGRHKGMSASTRLVISSFWEYAGFLVNSLIFLLLGLELQVVHLSNYWSAILLAIPVVLLGRMAAVYLLTPLSNLKNKTPISFAWQHILMWGGLRGALSMALVLSLPRDFPERNLLTALVFGVVLFSLIVQGLTIPSLINWLGLSHKESEEIRAYRRHKARFLSVQLAKRQLKELKSLGQVPQAVYDSIKTELTQEETVSEQAMQQVHLSDKDVIEEETIEIKSRLIAAQKDLLHRLTLEGVLSNDIRDELVYQMNEDLFMIREQTEKAEVIEPADSSVPMA